MISPSDNLFGGPSFNYVTYSYGEGLSNIMQILMVVSIVALISMIVSLIIGIRKKDCLAIFVANIMVKTVSIFIWQILYDLLYLDILFIFIFFIATVVIEGLIYKKVLKYKKYDGMAVSVVCNVVTVVITILMFCIFDSGFKILLDLLF